MAGVEVSVLCHGSTHVYLTGHARCTCGQAANGYPSTSSGHSSPTSGMIFQGYNPYSHHTPATPATPDVPLSRLRAAQLVRASHLSGDGLTAYTVRYGRVLQAEWKGSDFGAWLDIGEEMPKEAVAL